MTAAYTGAAKGMDYGPPVDAFWDWARKADALVDDVFRFSTGLTYLSMTYPEPPETHWSVEHGVAPAEEARADGAASAGRPVPSVTRRDVENSEMATSSWMKAYPNCTAKRMPTCRSLC